MLQPVIPHPVCSDALSNSKPVTKAPVPPSAFEKMLLSLEKPLPKEKSSSARQSSNSNAEVVHHSQLKQSSTSTPCSFSSSTGVHTLAMKDVNPSPDDLPSSPAASSLKLFPPGNHGGWRNFVQSAGNRLSPLSKPLADKQVNRVGLTVLANLPKRETLKHSQDQGQFTC